VAVPEGRTGSCWLSTNPIDDQILGQFSIIREYSIMGIFLPNGSLVMKYGGQGAATGIKS
jgi:hypothetical protein